MIPYIIVGVSSYLLGCIHPSYLLCKTIKKTDIREQGSKNSGTSNATIVLGLKYGVLTAVIDVLKGTFAVLIAGWLYGTANSTLLYFAGFCAILGHMFPFYMKFKGGKGLATLMGIAISLHFFMALVMFAFLVLGHSYNRLYRIGNWIRLCYVFCFGHLYYTDSLQLHCWQP